VLLWTFLLFAPAASAHAMVVSSTPADGSRLHAAPRAVTLTFDENVGLTGVGYLHVTDQAGRRVDAGGAFHPAGDPAKISDHLRSGLGDGTYTASFRVVSADSHPVAGTIRFVVGTGELAHGNLSGGSDVDPVTADAFDVARWLSYGGVALLGGAWLLLTLWPAGRGNPRAHRIVWSGWALAIVGTVAEMFVQGPYSAGSSLSRLGDLGLFESTRHSGYGIAHAVRLLVLAVLTVVLTRTLRSDERAPGRGLQVVAAGLAIVLAGTFAAVGHASSTSPTWLSEVLDAAHVLAMAAWVGGLLMLGAAVLPRRDGDELGAVLPRFSATAFACVVVLAVTGTYAAWRGVGTTSALFTTTYGLLVVAKVVLFVGLIGLGNLSRLAVQRRAAAASAVATDEEPPSTAAAPDRTRVQPAVVHAERLRRSVLVEFVVALAVLALTAVLVAEPRGKEALAASYQESVSATAVLGAGQSATVLVSPGVHGLVDVTVEIAGERVDSVMVEATQRSAQIGPLPIKLLKHSAHHLEGTANLPVAGPWDFDLVVTTAAVTAVTANVSLTLH
jgi:copper transport protein